jgi:hypothetical protein
VHGGGLLCGIGNAYIIRPPRRLARTLFLASGRVRSRNRKNWLELLPLPWMTVGRLNELQVIVLPLRLVMLPLAS